MDDEGNRGGNLERKNQGSWESDKGWCWRGGREGRYAKVCGFVLSLQFKLGIIDRFHVFTYQVSQVLSHSNVGPDRNS